MNIFTFSNTLTQADCKRHITHAFEVPQGATGIVIHMTYGPAKVDGIDNHLVISLFDPAQARGSRHYPGDLVEGNRRLHHIEVNEHAATFGFVAGPIQPGLWQAMIHTNMVLPDEPLHYMLDVEIKQGDRQTTDGRRPTAIPSVVGRPPSVVSPSSPRWFKGDLHAHTFHSDGDWDVPDLIAEARARGMDFVTLSDHNTASALAQMRGLAAPELLTMGGIELTTFYGHALALGVKDWIDWRVSDTRSMPDIAREVEAVGGTFVIAHPMTEGDPICTGCDWAYDDMMPGNARLVEVWNSGVWPASRNELALQLYYQWLNQGHRLVATSGTDTHGPASLEIQPGLDVVYADELSERAILGAIRQGHLYLSVGPKLELVARNTANETAMMGDVLRGDQVTLTICWDAARPSDALRLIVNGEPKLTLRSASKGQHGWALKVTEPTWCCAELREANGNMRALTNPIFLSPQS